MKKSILASSIDYPRDSLDPVIWDVKEDELYLQPKIKDQIDDIIQSFLDDLGLPPEALIGLYIYGSILTNQYNKNSDIDCRIVLDPEITKKQHPNLTGDDLFDLMIEKINNIPLEGTSHALNCSVVVEGEETLLGQAPLGKTKDDPVYDVLNERSVNKPYKEGLDLDPDEAFKQDKEEAEVIMSRIDNLIRKTKIDVIDYELIKDTIKDVKDPKKLIDKLSNKLKEIESDIEKLAAEYDEIKEKRSESLSSDALEDWRKARVWAKGNIIEKYLERYYYTEIIKQLKLVSKDGIEDSDIEEVKEILNVARKIAGRLPCYL